MAVVGVVGAGYWAQNMLRVIDESSRTRLKWIAELDPSKLEAAVCRYPTASPAIDAKTIFDDAEVDLVYIATPPSTHFELAIAALRAGKHVLVEKPITTSSAEAEVLIEQAFVQQRILMVGHTFLYSPPVLKVKELINNGTVGDVFYIDTQRVNLGRYQASGVMWDLAPHDLSIMCYWLGEVPCSVSTTAGAYRSAGREDVAFMSLEFPSGAVAQVHTSWLAPVKLRRTTVGGSQRMVVYDDTAGPEAIKVYNHGVDVPEPETFGEFQLSYRQGDIWIPRLETAEPLRSEWEHFVDSVENNRQPRSSADQGLAIVKILEAADRSIQSGSKETVDWSPKRNPRHRDRFGALTANQSETSSL